MIGCLTHSGYSHGGNGFEGMAFIIDQFKNADLKDPTDPNHGLDLKEMATRFAGTYRDEKAQSKESGAAEPRARASRTCSSSTRRARSSRRPSEARQFAGHRGAWRRRDHLLGFWRQRSKAGSHARGGAPPGRQVAVSRLPGESRRTSVARRHFGGDRDHHRLGTLMRKRISRLTAETLPWYLRL
jgi:hypothetical protein